MSRGATTKKKTPQTRSKRTVNKSRMKLTRGAAGHPPARFSKSTKRKNSSPRSMAAALRAAESALRKLKRQGAAAKRLAKTQGAQLARLKAEVKKRKKRSKSKRAEVTRAVNAVATKARHAVTTAPGKATRLGAELTYSGPEVPLPARAFPEGRLFRSGASVLGYFEGRPGIMGVRSVAPLHPPLGTPFEPAERERTPDVEARIDAIVDDIASDNDGDSGNLEEMLWEAYWDAEDFGAMVEADIDSDSGTAD